MMEFWLSFNNGAEKLQLPVPPSSFEIKTGNKNTVGNVNNIGEINLIGKKTLDQITISTFFPSKHYSFCQYTDLLNPYECVKMIKNWKGSGKPIRLLITETDINHAMAIESFSYGEKDGTRDIYFTLELKEYRFLNVSSSFNQAIQQKNSSNSRPSEKVAPKFYTVKKGDTLWAIAKKTYGNGSKYTQIASKNNIKDPKKLKIGQKLILG